MKMIQALLLVGAVQAQIPAPAIPGIPMCAGSTTETITVKWNGVAGTGLYDAEIMQGGNAPFRSITTQSTSATFGDLAAGMEYMFVVRAHALAAGPTQMIDGWSNFSEKISCKTPGNSLHTLHLRRTGPLEKDSVSVSWFWDSNPGLKSPQCGISVDAIEGDAVTLGFQHVEFSTSKTSMTVSPLIPNSGYTIRVTCGGVASSTLTVRTANPDTIWIEVFRVSENFVHWPDYLANHNSGSIEGDATFMTGMGDANRTHFFDFYESPRVRYCVELAKVNLTGIPRTPSGPPNIPTNYSFAEYLSCDAFNGAYFANYSCLCDNKIDRMIARQTEEQINKYCPQNMPSPGGPCNCDPGSIVESNKYIGYMPVSLPFAPFGPPSKEPAEHYGGWYSHPGDVKCPDDGSPVGQGGCTWRRDPNAIMVYGQDLLNAGWNHTGGGPGGPPIPNSQVKANTVAMRNAFNKISTRCCGC